MGEKINSEPVMLGRKWEGKSNRGIPVAMRSDFCQKFVLLTLFCRRQTAGDNAFDHGHCLRHSGLNDHGDIKFAKDTQKLLDWDESNLKGCILSA